MWYFLRDSVSITFAIPINTNTIMVTISFLGTSRHRSRKRK